MWAQEGKQNTRNTEQEVDQYKIKQEINKPEQRIGRIVVHELSI